jgi:hypothetical protein
LTMLLTSLSSPPPPSNATGVHPPPRPAPTRYGPPPPAPHPYPPKRHSANHKKPIGGFKKPFNYGKSQGRPQRPHLPPPPPPPQPRRNFKAPSRLHQRPKQQQQQQQQRQQYPQKQKQGRDLPMANRHWQCRDSGDSDILCRKRQQNGKDSVIEGQPLLRFM